MPPTTHITVINSKTALKAVTTAVATAENMGVQINACVVNAAGNRVAELSCDNVRVVALGLAFDKAFTANALRGATNDLFHRFKDNPQDLHGFGSASQSLVFLPGGIPIAFNGEVVGAIGISGASGAEDIEIAQSALKAIGADL